MDADLFDFSEVISIPGGADRHEWMKFHYDRMGRDFANLRRDIIEYFGHDRVESVGFGLCYVGYFYAMGREWFETEVEPANDNSYHRRTTPYIALETTYYALMNERLRHPFIKHMPFRRFPKISVFDDQDGMIDGLPWITRSARRQTTS